MKFLDQLLFYSCHLCGSENHPVPETHICPECMKKLHFFAPEYRCRGCGGENNTVFEVCPQCLEEPPRPWQDARTIFAYRGFARNVIHKFKFRRHSEIALPLGILAAELLKKYPLDCNLIVPVPLNFWKKMIRSYNQSELFAKVTARQTNIPFANLLGSKFSFYSQRSRNREERHQAIRNQFYLSAKMPPDAKILLVDDIFTTGSTLHAATEILLNAGAKSVCVLTAGRTLSAAVYNG